MYLQMPESPRLKSIKKRLLADSCQNLAIAEEGWALVVKHKINIWWYVII